MGMLSQQNGLVVPTRRCYPAVVLDNKNAHSAMDVTWSSVKEVFFAVGSVAGVLALLRPLVEAKLQRDSARVDRIKSLVNEQRLVDLKARIYQREVPCEDFEPFD